MRQTGNRIAKSALAVLVLLAFAAVPAFALEANEYRQILGLDSRKVIWF